MPEQVEDAVEEPSVVDVEETVTEPTPSSNWYDTLSPDLKEHPSVTKYKDINALAKDYVNLEKTIGKEKIVVPTDKSTKEEWNEYYKKIGRPDSFSDYETPDLEIEAAIKMQDHNLEAFKNKAHELGLNKKQFAELYGFYHELGQGSYNSALQQSQEMGKKSEAALRQEWGNTYEAKVDGAQQVINKFFKGKEIDPSFKQLANSKGFIQAMSEIASQVGEDVIKGGSISTVTPKQAQTELNSIIMDSNHPYHDSLHPEHNAAVDQVLSLQQAASAGQ